MSLVCVNVYLPTLCNTNNYEVDILNCFAFIDNIFTQHMDTCSNFIVIGDFNFDLTRMKKCKRLGDVQDFVDEYNFIACDHLDNNNVGYTYRYEGLNVQSTVDHAFVSSGIFDKRSNYKIIDSGFNFSDLCVILFHLMLDQFRIHTVNSANVNNVSSKSPSYIWNVDDIVNYQ